MLCQTSFSLEAHSKISYLADEASLSVKLGIDLNFPIRLFDLEGLNVDKDKLINDIAPTFESLKWDQYDVKQEQIHFLSIYYPTEKDRLNQFLLDYYSNKKSLQEIRCLINELPPGKRENFEAIFPYRKRSISQFIISYGPKVDLHIERVPLKSFSQNVADFRAYKRVFDETTEFVTSHPEFRRLLVSFGKIIKNVHWNVQYLSIIVHQVGIVARQKRPGDNAPEGIHQDGADYIVSTLIIERKGIKGGESTIYGPDKKTVYLNICLEPGQGIFQADSGSNLWHDVSPCYLDPQSSSSTGVRNILGFDFNILK